MPRLRVASLQYFIRPISRFDQFRDQVVGLVETAADYGSRLVVFPEYFTLQLMTLGDVKRPLAEQVRGLATQEETVVGLMAELAKQHDLCIVAGTIPHLTETGAVNNVCHIIGPEGKHGVQPKLHMTRFERDWGMTAGSGLSVFDTAFGRMAVAICYDVEFPELARAAARCGAHILAVPSCTDDRQGFLRVRYCAQARAVENQMYVIHASTVGSLPMVPAVSLNYGQAGIFTPSDFAFARDGILAEGIPNQETMIMAELNLETILETRESGTVLPLFDSGETQMRVAHTDGSPAVSEAAEIRRTRVEDFDGIIALTRRVYPTSPPWTVVQLASHLAVFPEGQFVATIDGVVVGMAASLIILWDDYDVGTNWRDFTDHGMFTNHDPERGRTLYAAEVMVDPQRQGYGIGGRLYEARRGLVVGLGLRRIRAGARLRGYHTRRQRDVRRSSTWRAWNGASWATRRCRSRSGAAFACWRSCRITCATTRRASGTRP